MKHTPHREDRPAPMERWMFVGLVFMAGMALGLAIASLIYGMFASASVAVLTAAVALGYVHWRLRESGWP